MRFWTRGRKIWLVLALTYLGTIATIVVRENMPHRQDSRIDVSVYGPTFRIRVK